MIAGGSCSVLFWRRRKRRKWRKWKWREWKQN